jgi:hypothetical protein
MPAGNINFQKLKPAAPSAGTPSPEALPIDRKGHYASTLTAGFDFPSARHWLRRAVAMAS